jgi:mono/diheme cytochrome c family protein
MRAKKSRARWLTPAVIAVAPLFASAAWADESATVTAGRGVATTWCVNCHVVTPAQTSGSDQAPTWSSIANRPGMTEARLRAFLDKPHGGMPDFKLAGKDIDNVVAYILSLKH